MQSTWGGDEDLPRSPVAAAGDGADHVKVERHRIDRALEQRRVGMRMGVDQPRHDDAAGGIHGRDVRARRCVETAGIADRANFAVPEPDLAILDDPVAPVEGEHRCAADRGEDAAVAVGCRLRACRTFPDFLPFQSVGPCSANRLTDAVKAILSELIAIPSTDPPGDTTAICAYAAERLAAAGYATETLFARGRCRPTRSAGWGKASRLWCSTPTPIPSTSESGRTGAPTPFVATEIDGKLHGIGAGNCKASMAVQLWLAERIAEAGGPRNGEVVFTFVGDEERLGPNGLSFLREEGVVRPDLPRPWRTDRTPDDRRGEGRVLDPADRARPCRPCRGSRGRGQRIFFA